MINVSLLNKHNDNNQFKFDYNYIFLRLVFTSLCLQIVFSKEQNCVFVLFLFFKNISNIWTPSSLCELTPVIFYMELIRLGSEASI